MQKSQYKIDQDENHLSKKKMYIIGATPTDGRRQKIAQNKSFIIMGQVLMRPYTRPCTGGRWLLTKERSFISRFILYDPRGNNNNKKTLETSYTAASGVDEHF